MSIQTTPPPEPGQAETYRPLSLLALAGLALALVAAAVVLLGGLLPVMTAQPGLFFASLLLTPLVTAAVAALRGVRGGGLALAALGGFAAWAVVLGLGGLLVLSRLDPWVLPAGFWVLAAAGAVLSWVARSQIRSSEDTLSGESLARLGLLVSVGVVVVYGAYYSSSMLAIQAQARACALDFLDQVKKGDPYEAYLRAIDVKSRPAAAELRDHIEVVHNTATPGPGGDATKFSSLVEGPLFRLIQMGGDQTTFEERGLNAEQVQGAYVVTFQYRGRTPFYTFDFQVTTQSQEVDQAGGGRRRAWNVLAGGTGLSEKRPAEPTDRGQDVQKRIEEASALLDQFLVAVSTDDFKTAFGRTRPPAEREAKPNEAALKEFLAGRTIDVSDAWTPDRPATLRGQALAAVRGLFDAKVARKVDTTEPLGVYGLSRSTRSSPAYAEADGRHRVTFPVRLLIRDAAWALPKYVTDLDVVVEGTDAGEYRVAGLRLVRAAPPPAEKGPKGPG